MAPDFLLLPSKVMQVHAKSTSTHSLSIRTTCAIEYSCQSNGVLPSSGNFVLWTQSFILTIKLTPSAALYDLEDIEVFQCYPIVLWT